MFANNLRDQQILQKREKALLNCFTKIANRNSWYWRATM